MDKNTKESSEVLVGGQRRSSSTQAGSRGRGGRRALARGRGNRDASRHRTNRVRADGHVDRLRSKDETIVCRNPLSDNDITQLARPSSTKETLSDEVSVKLERSSNGEPSLPNQQRVSGGKPRVLVNRGGRRSHRGSRKAKKFESPKVQSKSEVVSSHDGSDTTCVEREGDTIQIEDVSSVKNEDNQGIGKSYTERQPSCRSEELLLTPNTQPSSNETHESASRDETKHTMHTVESKLVETFEVCTTIPCMLREAELHPTALDATINEREEFSQHSQSINKVVASINTNALEDKKFSAEYVQHASKLLSQHSTISSPITILKRSDEKTSSSITILKRGAQNEKKTLKQSLTDIVNQRSNEILNESILVEQIALMPDVMVNADEIAEYVKPSSSTIDVSKQRPRKSSSRLNLAENTEQGSEESNRNSNDRLVEVDINTTQSTVSSSTATKVLAALPAQEVSITASSSVRRTSSVTQSSVSHSSSVINLNSLSATGSSLTTNNLAGKKKKVKSGVVKKTKDNDKAKARAAMLFNRAVRECVERSDPDTMRCILRDPANKNYALDATVLETVMKAYVMAAMFEDALFCLRHCTLPGTLSAHQTERILTCLPQNLRNSSTFVAADMINALSIATEFDNPKKRTYFLRIVRGISLEFLEEATSARDRICNAPCERLIRAALCVVDAQFKRGRRVGELVASLGNQLGVFIPEGNFMDNRGIQSGDAVSILPYSGPYPMSAESLDRNMIEATVAQTSPLVLKLQDRTNASLIQRLTEPGPENVYRIDKLANRMGFNRELAAAVAIASGPSEAEKGLSRKDQRRPCPELIDAITAMDENIDRMLLGAANGNYDTERYRTYGQNSTASLCSEAIPIWISNSEDEGESQECIRDKTKLLLDKHNALNDLNNSQKLAIEGAVTNRLTLIQGPPGTGKTMVAIRIIKYWATLASYEDGGGCPVLATSDSNIAVDNLVEGCAKEGLRVVRLGRPEAVRPELLQYCIDRPGANSSSSNLSSMETQDAISSQIDSGYTSSLSASSYKEKMKRMKAAQVICCTCIGSGADILDSMYFERVLVDEATQATEPAVLVPLTRGCRQLVLVGDHCQLPPTVLSTHAEEEGLGVPLFSRMVACGVPPFMLDTQYRMHPSIAMFPSDLFYGGKLLNGVSAPERRPLAGFPWPRMEFPVAFVPINDGVEVDDGQSKYNEAEAFAACNAVSALLDGGQCNVTDIAVVTPYSAQVRLIRRMLRKLVQRPPYVEVSSVDGFQGREKEAVIFSAVRSNDNYVIGFVSDWRRMNVSFTRARRALIVLGNEQTLRRGDPDTWLPWLAWADAHGVNMEKPGVPRGRYDCEQLRRIRGGTTAADMLKHVLERQQTQLKVAEQQLQKAERDAAGHVMGQSYEQPKVEEEEEQQETEPTLVAHEFLAKSAKVDGCWDDSDDEASLEIPSMAYTSESVSIEKLGSLSSEKAISSVIEAAVTIQDAWDL